MDPDYLLNVPVVDLTGYLVSKYDFNVPEIREENIVVDEGEKLIDVSHNPRYLASAFGGPHSVTGSEVSVWVPFEGNRSAFDIRPSTFSLNPPRAELEGSCLVLRIAGVDLQVDAVKHEIEQVVARIKVHLVQLESDSQAFNSGLPTYAQSLVEARREKLLASRGLVASLGYKLKERSDAPRTFAAPLVRRRMPTPPPASTAPFHPEPALPLDEYEHIIDVIARMALVMERSPTAFRTLGEEDIRTHFLLHLNGHYEGQATAETFNFEGKTDILVRSGDKNVFIAECKVWKGPKALLEAVDQLLSYSSWRDSKTAIILFNRNRNFSKVLEAIPTTIRKHRGYKDDLMGSKETRFRYRFVHRDDRNKELILTVLAFDVPGPDLE